MTGRPVLKAGVFRFPKPLMMLLWSDISESSLGATEPSRFLFD